MVPVLTLWFSQILDGRQRQAGVGDEVGEVTVAQVVIGATVLHAAQRDQIIIFGSAKDGTGFEIRQ